MHGRTHAITLTPAVWALFVAHTARAAGISRIATSDTPIPNGTGNFVAFTQPQVGPGYVAFAGAGTGAQRGIYRYHTSSGTLSVIADATTNLPKPAGTTATPLPLDINAFGLSSYGPDVSFQTPYDSPTNLQLLSTRGGSLHQVTVVSSPSAAPFQPRTSTDATRTLVRSMLRNTITIGVPYVKHYHAVLPDGTIPPSLNNGTDKMKFLARNGGAAFSYHVSSSNQPAGAYLLSGTGGTFRFSDGALTGLLAAPGFFLPGKSTGFTLAGSGEPVFNDDGTTTVFVAAAAPKRPDGTAGAATQRGVYSKTGTGALRAVATDHTVVPSYDGSTTFARFDNVAIDDDIIVFIAAPASGPDGIYAESAGALSKILSVGDALDGKTVTSLSFSDDRPFSGEDLVFTATFSDGSTGLYLSSVPEPATFTLLACGAIPGLLRRRRHPARAI